MKKPRISIKERWEQGVLHDPRSIALFESIRKIDDQHNNGSMEWKTGGDGDNGEELMYLLDVHYESVDHENVLEVIASKVHDEWMEEKKKQGFFSMISAKGENLFVPYFSLSEEQKNLDRKTAFAVLEGIEESGRMIVKV